MKKVMSFILAIICVFGIVPVYTMAEDPQATNPDYAYFMNTTEDSAYSMLGETIENKGMEFFDGIGMGITEKSNAFYNEIVLLDGLYARKQYSSNNAFFKINKDFYETGDTEFLISIVFYDFGPSEGKFYFEYFCENGATKQLTLVKPGTNPGWAVKTVCLDDMDLTKEYENGANFRIINGAYNAFKKVEVINLSKAKREKKNVPVTCLGVELRTEMESLRMIDINDERFINSNLGKECSSYDAYALKNVITTGSAGTVSEDTKNVKITQGELLDIFFQALNITKKNDESYAEAAERLGITDAADFFLFDEAPATNYNLISIAHAALVYEPDNGEMILAKLIKTGFYEGMNVAEIKSDVFQYIYYLEPRKLPYETITDHATGRTYHYINFFGTMLNRGYLTMNGWLSDGSGFICATPSGYIYLYDIKTQIIRFLDKGMSGTDPKIWASRNGWIYYLKEEDGQRGLWRMNPDTNEKELLYIPPVGITLNDFSLTNDGNYAAIDVSDPTYLLERPQDTKPIIRLNVKEQKLEYRYYGFSFSNSVGHIQINPEDPNILSFIHNAKGVGYADIYDRCQIMFFDTGKVIAFEQGQHPNGQAVQLITHEVWAHNGEYMYFCAWHTNSDYEYGKLPAVIRINPDGTHRQYYLGRMALGGVNHSNISGDGRMIAADSEHLSLISTETEQLFPIIPITPITGSVNHPYHPHPHLSYTGNMVSWGHVRDGVLGIAWMDYTDIIENEVKKGGRYPFGNDVARISYEDLECESKITTKAGRECIMSSPGTSIFLDINPEVVDVDNAAVKITFDYYDNTNRPLTITYTKGVEEKNDVWKIFNKTVDVRREDTNKWKTAEVVIDCGNFESIGKYESDFKITSGAMNAYISNIKVEAINP